MMCTHPGYGYMKVARLYLRVSTEEQDLTRQADIEVSTRAAGYYVAGVYREKASGARTDRPELLRMIADLQPGEVVVAEKIDRLSRLPLAEAEQLVNSIRAKGAKLAVPGLVDLSEIAAAADGGINHLAPDFERASDRQNPDELRWDQKTAEFRSNAEAITGRFADIKAERSEYLSRKAGEPESSQDSIRERSKSIREERTETPGWKLRGKDRVRNRSGGRRGPGE